MTAIETIILWLAYLFLVYLFLPLVICFGLFFYAWCMGWQTDDLSPDQILRRLSAPKDQL